MWGLMEIRTVCFLALLVYITGQNARRLYPNLLRGTFNGVSKATNAAKKIYETHNSGTNVIHSRNVPLKGIDGKQELAQ